MSLMQFRGGQQLPDGVHLDDLLMWSFDVGPRSVLTRGFELEVPDLASLGTPALNAWHHGWRGFLGAHAPDMRGQLHYFLTSDYRGELDDFEDRKADSASQWGSCVCEERVRRYRDRQSAGQLRRERTLWFAGKPAGGAVPGGGFHSRTELQEFVATTGASLTERVRSMAQHLPPGSDLRPLEAFEHHREMRRYFQPDLAPETLDDPHSFNPLESILHNALGGGAVSVQLPEGECALRIGGWVHAVAILTGWPETFGPGIVLPLLRSGMRNLRITQVFEPRDPEPEKAKLKKDLERFTNAGNKVSANNASQRLEELQGGRVTPFGCMTILTTWGASIEETRRQLSRLKVTIGTLPGARYYVPDEPSQALEVWKATLPGYFGGAREWQLPEISDRLAGVVCAANGYTGALKQADALYDTDAGGIAGVALHRGSPPQPQHGFVIGTTGAGKSIFLSDLIAQVAPGLGFCAIVDNGMSHATLAHVHHTRAIHIFAGSDVTLNPFDCGHLPLSDDVLSTARQLLMLMLGKDVPRHVGPTLDVYIRQAFEDLVSNRWREFEEERLQDAALAQLVETYRHEARLPAGTTFLDAFCEVLELRRTVPDQFETLWSHHAGDPQRLEAWLDDPRNRAIARDVACARLKEMPTLSVLVDMLAFMPLPKVDPALAKEIALELEPWRAGGRYGGLFDGQSSLSLGRAENQRLHFLHFELGRIPKEQQELRRITIFLLSATIRRLVMTLPRGMRKVVLVEELAPLFDLPEGAEWVGELTATMRKYLCAFLGAFQSPRQLGEAMKVAAIKDNIRQYFLLRQATPEIAQIVADSIGLSDTAREELTSFPTPEHMSDGDRSGYVLHVQTGSGRVESGVLRVRVSEEVLWVAESSGDTFDKRERLLAAYDDPIEGVLSEVFRVRMQTATP